MLLCKPASQRMLVHIIAVFRRHASLQPLHQPMGHRSDGDVSLLNRNYLIERHKEVKTMISTERAGARAAVG